MKQCRLILLAMLCLILPGWGLAQPVSDEYLAGYTRAVLDRELNLPGATVEVDKGTIWISLPQEKTGMENEVRSALDDLPKGAEVRFSRGASRVAAEPAPTEGLEEPSPQGSEFLPDNALFAPLQADPRWPHFSASYHRYLDQDDLENVGHVGFGETFIFYRRNSAVRWEFGLQAGVFSIFDLDADSFDLVNADYRVSLPVFYRWRALSGAFRILHQSSHLGDEFILGGRAEDRVNLSYEKADGILSVDLPFGGRLYGGGGYLVHSDPSDLDPWSAQGGFEWVCPTGLGDILYPVAAVDVQSEEENNWDLDVSAKAGLQLGHAKNKNRSRLQLTLEYYQGHSPNGQFYKDIIEYVGLGLHYYR